MAWFEHNGSRIYYEDEGAGDPVLMLPGWSLSIEDFSALRAALAPAFRVISADLPGSGKSTPQPRAYTATYYHDDARAFLALLQHLGAAPAHLIGFSDGGEVELVMAGVQPDAAKSLLTWGAAGTIAVSPDLLDAMANVVDSPIEPMKEFSQYLKDAYGEGHARAMSQSFSQALRAIMDAGGDVSRSSAPRIACPALLITGEHDFFAAPPVVSEIAQAIPGGEFLEVKGASHAIHHEQPEWFTQTVVGWLKKRG